MVKMVSGQTLRCAYKIKESAVVTFAMKEVKLALKKSQEVFAKKALDEDPAGTMYKDAVSPVTGTLAPRIPRSAIVPAIAHVFRPMGEPVADLSAANVAGISTPTLIETLIETSMGSTIDTQSSSSLLSSSLDLGELLFMIPQEIRDEIYAYVFSSSRLVFGGSNRVILPSQSTRRPLALLAVCSRIRSEIGTSWARYATLDFESPNRMLQKLLTIPAPIGDVRYVRVTGLLGILPYASPSVIVTPWPEFFVHEFLRILEGLRLYELTIIACSGRYAHEYQALQFLLKYSNGWKRLSVWYWASYLLDRDVWPSFNDLWFEHRYQMPDHRRGELPSAFRKILNDRDGRDNKPLLRMIHGSQAEGPSFDIHQYTVQQILARSQARIAPLAAQDYNRQMVIIAERGQGVSYTVKPLVRSRPHHAMYFRVKHMIQVTQRSSYRDWHGF